MGVIGDAARLRPVDAAWAFAIRAGLAVSLPLVVLTRTGHASWAGIATFGAFTALYARDEHYRSRAATVALAGAGLVAAVTVGTFAAAAPSPAVAGVIAVSLVGGVATLLCMALRVGPPAGLMFAFATAVCSALPATAGDVARNAALSAAAAAVAWVIVMAGAAVDRDAPRRLAVARALRLAAALHDAPGGPAGLRLRHQAAAAVARAWGALPLRPSTRRADTIAALEALVARAESALGAGPAHGDGPGDPAEAARLRALADGLVRRGPIPRLRCTLPEAAEVAGRHEAAVLAGPHRDLLHRDLLRRGGAANTADVPRRPLLPVALRVALGALAAGVAAGGLVHVTGLGHPYWAAVSAVAVLQASSLLVSLHRAMQRAVGTLVGLLLAAAAVAVPGGHWTLVAEIVGAQVVAEVLVVRNYGLAMLAVTPLAVLVGELGRPTAPLTLIGDRLTQTVLGCLVGLGCAAVIRNRAAVRHLRATVIACAEATAQLRSLLAAPDDPPPRPAADGELPATGPSVTGAAAGPVQREHTAVAEQAAAEVTARARRLALLVDAVREAYEVAAGEPGVPDGTTERVLAVERHARQALAAATPRLTPVGG
jgi:Fusaric acid resistance protein-like